MPAAVAVEDMLQAAVAVDTPLAEEADMPQVDAEGDMPLAAAEACGSANLPQVLKTVQNLL